MKKKMSKTTKTLTALVVALSLVFISLLTVTVAWFTDSKSYTNKLDFGNVQLDVTGDKIDNANKKITFSFGEGREDATKAMPGDKVSMAFTVGLTSTSDPAYYLVSVTDTKGVFKSATYYYDGTNIKENNDTNKGVGSLSGTIKHSFTIPAEIKEDLEDQGGSTDVSLNIFAVQQANLEAYNADDTSHSAYHILSKKIDLAVNGVNLPSVSDIKGANGVFTVHSFSSSGSLTKGTWDKITTLGFYHTKDKPNGYEINSTLTTSLDSKLEERSKGQIKIYTKSDTEIAFVSDYKINAPEDCSFFFGSLYNEAFTSISLSNFDTRNVTNMNHMFAYCNNLTTLDLSSFDTSKVTEMRMMFTASSSLTSLDISSFNTSKVTNMHQMFAIAFSTTASTKTLTIGDGFVVNGAPVTKAVLTATGSGDMQLNSSVTVMRNGVEVTE